MKAFALHIVFTLIFASPLLASASSIPIGELQKGEYIGKHLYILNSEKLLKVEDLSHLQNKFIQSEYNTPRFGYTNNDIWARLKINNDQQVPQTIYFEFHGPIEKVFSYLVRDSKVIHTAQSGMTLTRTQEDFQFNYIYPILKMEIPVGISTVYFNDKAIAPHFPIIAHSFKTLSAHSQKKNLLTFAYLGACLFLLVSIILIFGMTRNKLTFLLLGAFTGYLFLTGFVNGFLRLISKIYFANSNTFTAFYLFVYDHWIIFLSLYLSSLSIYAVAKHYSKVKKQKKWLRIFTYTIIAGQILLGIVSLLDKIIAMNTFAALNLITIFQAATWAHQDIKEGRSEALSEFIGWMVYLTFSGLQLAYFLNVAKVSFFASWGTNLGFIVVISSLSISILLKLRDDLTQTGAMYKNSLEELKTNFSELKKRDEIIKLFVDPVINTELALGRNPISYKPKIVQCTVMFFDMRGFTAKMERLRGQDLIEFSIVLNQYVQIMIDIVAKYDGHIQKIIGDAIMSDFKNPESCIQACKEIRLTLSELNRTRTQRGEEPIKFGTGISQGNAIKTNLGSNNVKLDRTILGNVVNQASKIEGVTKNYNLDVLVDETVYNDVTDKSHFRWIGYEHLGGKKEMTNLYEFFGHNKQEVINNKIKSKKTLNQLKLAINNLSNPSLALNELSEIIKSNPKHTYYKGKIMDQSLIKIKEKVTEQYKKGA